MLNIRNSIIIILLGFVCFPANSQEIDKTYTLARIIDGDTVPIIKLPEILIVAPIVFESRRDERRYNRLVRNVKVVYPYARLAGIKFREYSQKLEEIESDVEQRLMMKRIEDELRDQFEDDLRKLTFSQGLILLKLIDRETQHTSYDILIDFRGMFHAFFWQSMGRLFGYDLRTKYDPQGEDKMIEHIIMLIEAGVI